MDQTQVPQNHTASSLRPFAQHQGLGASPDGGARNPPRTPAKSQLAAFRLPVKAVHNFRLLIRFCVPVLAPGLSCFAYGADSAAARQLAADRGCYNCHAQPSPRRIRSFADIAHAYAPLRGKPGAEQQARDRMHHGGLFSHVAAHERLTEEEATLLVHWLFEGGR